MLPLKGDLSTLCVLFFFFYASKILLLQDKNILLSCSAFLHAGILKQ